MRKKNMLACGKQTDGRESNKEARMHILEGFVGKQYKAIVAHPISPKSMDDLREAFTVFDKNSDGFISKQELSEAMENFGHMISNSELEEMINLVDKDGNGLIDFHEFLNLMDSNTLVQNIDQEMESLFGMIDTNNDGFISEKELKAMMKGLGEKVRKKDIRKMIKEADMNKDGKISFCEFKRMVASGNFLSR
ncbi:neo-calmodulin-like isoform X2 [Hydractinia symbiolongicarpus]|uniref:neo-calmodulin-like isoform X2 n=1 Tax=Hydractinia symbiolongicarpus TaxID=13093 RepID=UPI00254AF137|nr:neo-calmodulin-like isoform X2 [Hydractinia symbiolongicarpus]